MHLNNKSKLKKHFHAYLRTVAAGKADNSDTFAVLRLTEQVLRGMGQGIGILVSKIPKETSASYSLREPSEVETTPPPTATTSHCTLHRRLPSSAQLLKRCEKCETKLAMLGAAAVARMEFPCMHAIVTELSPTWTDPVYCLSGAAGEGVPAHVGQVQAAAGLVMVQAAEQQVVKS